MTGIDQLPCLLDLLFESDNGGLVLLTEAQSCLHLGSIPHNLTIQLLDLLCQPLLIVCKGKAQQALNDCRTRLNTRSLRCLSCVVVVELLYRRLQGGAQQLCNIPWDFLTALKSFSYSVLKRSRDLSLWSSNKTYISGHQRLRIGQRFLSVSVAFDEASPANSRDASHQYVPLGSPFRECHKRHLYRLPQQASCRPRRQPCRKQATCRPQVGRHLTDSLTLFR